MAAVAAYVQSHARVWSTLQCAPPARRAATRGYLRLPAATCGYLDRASPSGLMSINFPLSSLPEPPFLFFLLACARGAIASSCSGRSWASSLLAPWYPPTESAPVSRPRTLRWCGVYIDPSTAFGSDKKGRPLAASLFGPPHAVLGGRGEVICERCEIWGLRGVRNEETVGAGGREVHNLRSAIRPPTPTGRMDPRLTPRGRKTRRSCRRWSACGARRRRT